MVRNIIITRKDVIISVAGIIIGVGLTLIGVWFQQRYDKEKYKQEMLNEMTCSMNKLYQLGRNVVYASNSTVFPDRWERYINEGYIPYLTKNDLYKNFIEYHYPKLLEDVKTLDSNFIEVDYLNILIRREQCNPSPYKEKKENLNNYCKQAREKYEQIAVILKKINKEAVK